jgi:hypothetical protein
MVWYGMVWTHLYHHHSSFQRAIDHPFLSAMKGSAGREVNEMNETKECRSWNLPVPDKEFTFPT